jgi:hypothetical protein
VDYLKVSVVNCVPKYGGTSCKEAPHVTTSGDRYSLQYRVRKHTDYESLQSAESDPEEVHLVVEEGISQSLFIVDGV